MEVSGRRDERPLGDTIGRSSTEDGDTFCQPCSSDDDWVAAVGYCQNCCEYFCAACMKLHRKQSMSKNHVILKGDDMPKAQVVSMKLDTCSELCDRHKSEILKFYCSSHDVVVCGDCMVLNHKTCKVERIQDISNSYLNGPEHRELQMKVEKLREQVYQVRREIRSSETNIKHFYSKAMDDIKVFRKEINDFLDRAEKDIMSELTKRKRENERLIEKLNNDEQIMRQEIAEIHDTLKLQANQANKLFVSAKQTQGKLAHLDSSIKEMFQSSRINPYVFYQSPELTETVATNVPLGELKEKKGIKVAKMEPEFSDDINIKTVEDKKDCYICASALLSESQIVLADLNNKCVKMVNIDKRKITARYELTSEPLDIAVVSPTLIAVPFEHGEIQFLSVTKRSSFTKRNDIQASGCLVVAGQNETVLAAYEDSVKIMNTSGIEQKIIPLSCLTWPVAVTFGTETDTFYVSDSTLPTVVYKFNFDGNVISKYEDKSLSDVRGLAVTREGTVLVCNWADNGSIHIISPDCKKIKEILRDNNFIKYPFSVSFCSTANKLFVTNFEESLEPQLKNVLMIFRMK